MLVDSARIVVRNSHIESHRNVRRRSCVCVTVRFRMRPRFRSLRSTRNDTQQRIGQSYSTTRHRTSAPICPLRNHRRPSKPLREFISTPIPEKADAASRLTWVDKGHSTLDVPAGSRTGIWSVASRLPPSDHYTSVAGALSRTSRRSISWDYPVCPLFSLVSLSNFSR